MDQTFEGLIARLEKDLLGSIGPKDVLAPLRADPAIEKIRRGLWLLGFDVKKSGNAYDEELSDAVLQFQSLYGAANADGLFGPRTRRRLSEVLVYRQGEQVFSKISASSAERNPGVFISYLSDDREVVSKLACALRAYRIEVWLDREELTPGSDWKAAIRTAISEGDFFIACFSEAYYQRKKSYMNEELTLAVEELRQRSPDRPWFIPVLLSDCKIPARDIGGGRTLRDLQWVELHSNWHDGIASIAKAIDPDAGRCPTSSHKGND